MSFFLEPTNLILVALALVSGGMLAWSALGKSKSGVSPSEATLMINRRNATVIDVRTETEFAGGHLPQSRRIDADAVATAAAGIAKDKAAPVIVVCATGMRSRAACRQLQRAGYAEVYSLEGGLTAWQQAGLPVVRQGKA